MSNPYVGEIKIWGLGYQPRGWASCNGQTLGISQNQALFALLGTSYGGDGQTNFKLPDLRSRVPVGATVNGSAAQVGMIAGSETVPLNATQLPPHSHALIGTSTLATGRPVLNRMFANDTSDSSDFFAPSGNLVAISPAAMLPTGSSQPHPNIQPYTVLNYCIALVGIFPSRN